MLRHDRSTRLLLSVIALLLGANLLVQVTNSGSTRTAYGAGIPDSGAQMQAIVDQLSDLNKKVDKMEAFLESGKLAVKADVQSTK